MKCEMRSGKTVVKWPGKDQKAGYDKPDKKKHYIPITYIDKDGDRDYSERAFVASAVGRPKFVSAQDVYDKVIAAFRDKL